MVRFKPAFFTESEVENEDALNEDDREELREQMEEFERRKNDPMYRKNRNKKIDFDR
jgi:hypothetical protein